MVIIFQKGTLLVENKSLPLCIWLTDNHIPCYVLDGDVLRNGINADLGFSEADRSENIRRVSHIAKILMNAGITPIISLISPFKKDRELAKAIIDPNSFIEVYLQCSLESCIQRDPKGLYKKALGGEILNFTGLDSPCQLLPPIEV
jgi:adenylyl-sulfate kinase